MEQFKLKASLRTEKGKQEVKKLRAKGTVPGVVYHRGEEPIHVIVQEKELLSVIHVAGGENVVVSLAVEKDKKSKSRMVILKEVQHDPVKRNILHVDFNEISLTEKIIVDVELLSIGEPIGVKQQGGFLDHPVRQIKIQCLPTDIPKNIQVDVSGLKLNDSIHVRDLVLSDKIKVVADSDALLFQVKIHEEKVEEAVAEAPTLEVIREKKEAEAPKGEVTEEQKADKK